MICLYRNEHVIENLRLKDGTRAICNSALRKTCAIGNAPHQGLPIKSIEFPEGLEEIGKNAFWECVIPNVLTFPDTLRYIHSHAFVGSYVKKVTIPKNLNMALDAFDSSYIPDSFEVHPDNPYFMTECDLLYTKDKSTLIKCLNNNIIDIDLPQSLRRIITGAFVYSSINTLVVPEGVKQINYDAFRASHIENLKITNKDIKVCKHGFDNCLNVYLPEGTTHIVKKSGCLCSPDMQNVYLLENKEEIRLPDGLKKLCDMIVVMESTRKIIVPESLTSICSNAIQFYGKLEIVLHNNMKHISKYAFDYHSGWRDMIILRVPHECLDKYKRKFSYYENYMKEI